MRSIQARRLYFPAGADCRTTPGRQSLQLSPKPKNTTLDILNWPDETAAAPAYPLLSLPGSNICLDLHGDPLQAGLVVFSDGNHHMALAECLRGFLRAHPQARDVFYCTTPPRLALEALKSGGLRVGNLSLSIRPHLLISPPAVLEQMVQAGFLRAHQPFVRSRGSVLLVRKDNPESIRGVADLCRPGMRLFISNPNTETVSFTGYAETLRRLASARGAAIPLDGAGDAPRLVFGQAIHHREAPEAVASGRADAAIVYTHLALRYTRVFPGMFDIVALAEPDDPDNLRAAIHIGLAAEPGPWGGRALDQLTGPECAAAYRRHGLDPEF
jgi:ABC-type amino acid transport substrate-binding protein